MNLIKFLGKNIRVTFKSGNEIEGFCDDFIGKLDTDNELYNELTMIPFSGKLKGQHVVFDETEPEKIEIID